MASCGGFDRRAFLAGGAALGAGLLPRGRASGAQATATSLPASLDRSAFLIAADDLADALAGAPPPLVVALTDPASWASGHIAGARRIDYPELELAATTPDAIASWVTSTRTRLGALGITSDRPVVLYDGGTLFAARLWWILDALGHPDTRILDGGLPAWLAAGGTVETGDQAGATPESDPSDYPGTLDDRRLATLDEVTAALADPAVVIVDARVADEYAAGHIPGAVDVNYPRNAAPDDPRTYRSTVELLALYAAVGVTPDQMVIPYCSTGVRSAVTAFSLRLAGFPDVALYSGSWAEWGSDPSTPKVTGPEPG